MKKVAEKFAYYENSQYLCGVKFKHPYQMEEKTITKEISEKEWELIQAIRNYKRAYPNGAKNFIAYIRQVLDELIYG